MIDEPTKLRTGWTTGACATAAVKAALDVLSGGPVPKSVSIMLPRGQEPVFAIQDSAQGPGWASIAIEKDAGDDPDVTHGCLVWARVQRGGGGVSFRAGQGIGMVTKPGLPIAVGEPAINPVPRKMMTAIVEAWAEATGEPSDVIIEISIPNGAALAAKTWNPRLGIEGGLSILGTTGIVRPFSCAAWIASIHRGIDVARANGLDHVAGCTGATSEAAVQNSLGLSDHAMLDMGDFAGGMLKYLRQHPVPKLTIGGGIGKLTKFAQGAGDLHSKRSQVDFVKLSTDLSTSGLAKANTALQAYEETGDAMIDWILDRSLRHAQDRLEGTNTEVSIMVVDRQGTILGST